MNEDQLQIAVVEYLRFALPAAAVFWHTPNGGLRSKATAARFRAMGVLAGIPDLFIGMQGKSLIGIELKVGRNKRTPIQEAMGEALKSIGIDVHVARSVAEVENILIYEGFGPLKGRLSA